MFDKAKALHKAKKLKSQMDKQMAQISHFEERGENSVVVRADSRIEKIKIDGDDRRDVKDLLNEAFKQVAKKAEKEQEKLVKERAGDVRDLLGI